MKYIIFFLFINLSFSSLIKPINNSHLNYIHVLFEWDQEPDAVSYNFQLSISENFNNDNIILEHNEISTIFIEKNLIDWENTYYWRIQPIYNDASLGDFSDTYTFTTMVKKTNISTNIIDDSINLSNLTAFCNWDNFSSSIFDIYGNEIWNDGNINFIFTEVSDFGELFGHINTGEDVNTLRAVEVNFNSEILWEEPQYRGLDIHEFIQMPSNNYLAFYNYQENGPIPIGNWTPLFQSVGYVADGLTNEYPWVIPTVIEFDSTTKEVVWSWDALDFFSINDYSNAPWSNALNLGRYDWLHMNSIYFDELESAIYLSFRHISRISKISYPSGDLIWNMGYMSFDNSSICSELGFTWQHYARILGDGSLLFLDNGNFSTVHMNDQYPTTRIRKIRVIDDSHCETEWEYAVDQDLFSPGMGSVQELYNNNYLVNSIANNGQILEISNNGSELWRANLNLDSPKNYRAFRIPGIHPEAYSVIFHNYFNMENLSSIIYPTLVLDIHNKSKYSQPYIYNISDSNNCFDSLNDTIFIESESNHNLVFNYTCVDTTTTDIEFVIKPQYHEYSIKEYDMSFTYLDYDFNNDNIINLRDIILLINYITDDYDSIDLNNSYDINNDQQINLLDVIILINFILN